MSDQPEDPRALARRLAEEAKNRVRAKAAPSNPPAPPPEDPRELARRLAEDAKRKLDAVPKPPPNANLQILEATPDTAPAPRVDAARSVAARAGAPKAAMSATEALQAAREAEKRAREQRPPPKAAAPPPPLDRTDAPRPRVPEVPAAPVTKPTPPAATLADTAQLVSDAWPGAISEPAVPVGQREVFRALWRAHRTRAQHDGQIGLVATASALVDAVDRIAPGRLVAARVTIASEPWAVWVDLDRRAILAALQPADVFLAGL